MRELGKMPRIAAIIPTYGEVGIRLTSTCLASLFQVHDLPEDDLQVIVVDDGSGERVVRELQSVCDGYSAELVVREENGGFAKTCNAGLRRSNGIVSILLNNDVYFDGCPLLQIMADACHSMGAGVVGSRLLYPDGRIQHAGVVFVPVENQPIPGYFDHTLRFEKAWHPDAVTLRRGLITGALMGIHRSVINAIGLLDERYGMAVEDIDYQLDSISAGLPVVYQGYGWAYHAEGRTRGSTPEEKEEMNPEAWLKEKASLLRFYEKWRGLNFSMFSAIE